MCLRFGRASLASKKMIEFYVDLRGRMEPKSEYLVEVECINLLSSEEEAAKAAMKLDGSLALRSGREDEDCTIFVKETYRLTV